MKTAKYLILTCLIFALYSHLTFAQEIKIKCAGEKYVIPQFRHDTVAENFTEKQFEKLNILQPIQNSDCEIELRGYYNVVSFSGTAIIIKCKDHKFIAEAYRYKYRNGYADSIVPKGFIAMHYKKAVIYYSVKTIELPDTILNSLIKNKLFTLPNSKFIVDSLKAASVNVDRNNTFFDKYSMDFELKVNNNYRSFNCDPFMWVANQSIKGFLDEKVLFDEFESIYEKTGQDRTIFTPDEQRRTHHPINRHLRQN